MDRYINLRNEIALRKPQSILEIGTWNGNHAKEMIQLAQQFNKHITYYGFDLFEDFDLKDSEFCPKQPAKYQEVWQKLQATKAKIWLIKGNTNTSLHGFPFSPVDFIFIDGGHSLETINNDWNGIQPAIYSKTVILFDDYYLKRNDVGCQLLIHSLEEIGSWNIEYLKPIDECNGGTQMVKITPKF